ncbi:ATP-binding protein [Cohnella soli]|uniref:ATP-binding protein n=1 Tax=Cohnella soli TaxID=425005 RepID=A0ABW0I2B2_9BACL
MVRSYTSPDIFQPTSYPEYTYVNRLFDERETYKERLNKALRTKGILALITGASKSGKTVLCYSVIPVDKIVEISGSHIRALDDFWIQIAEKLQIPVEIETTTQQSNETSFGGEAGGKAGIPLLADLSLKGTTGAKFIDIEATKEKQQRSKSSMIDYMIQNQNVLVIDDFHYVTPEIQKYIARVLKSEIFRGLKAVVVSLPHRSDDAIRLNPDLIGRVRYINIEPWSPEELSQIPKKGFELLGITVANSIVDLLVEESITSPQLMQQNCLNLAYELNIDEDLLVVNINDNKYVYNAFVETTRDYENYNPVIQKLITGPPQGRDKRIQYKLRNGTNLDIYHVILKMLAEDPPLISIDIAEIQQRITKVLLVGEKPPNPLTVSNTLAQIQKILQETGEMFQILEWREQKLYVLDPFFLFYLRWNK